MNLPSFTQGAAMALALAATAAVVASALAPTFDAAALVRVIVPLLSGIYMAWLVSGRRRAAGRPTAFLAWLTTAACASFFVPDPAVQVLLHAGLLWIVRSILFHRHLLPALADLILGCLAVAASAWSMSRTGSVALSVWTFFLVHAAFVFLHQRGQSAPLQAEQTAATRFLKARRLAEAALDSLDNGRRTPAKGDPL